MKRQMREENKNSQYTDSLASEYGLDNHGLNQAYIAVLAHAFS